MDKQEAALETEDEFVIDGGDQTSEQTSDESQTTESATVEASEPESTEAEKPAEDGFQKRINKVTADKHEERRKREAADKRADDLQKQLDEQENKKPALTKPTLENHEYDEESFNKASVAFEVQEQVRAELATQKVQAEHRQQQSEQQKTLDKFNENVLALGVEGFDAKAATIPELPSGVANAIIGLENGAEMIQHLFTHLDEADTLASMTPMVAMMELGKISSKMSAKQAIKQSAAPDPIETLSSGGVVSKERGPLGATYD